MLFSGTHGVMVRGDGVCGEGVQVCGSSSGVLVLVEVVDSVG